MTVAMRRALRRHRRCSSERFRSRSLFHAASRKPGTAISVRVGEPSMQSRSLSLAVAAALALPALASSGAARAEAAAQSATDLDGVVVTATRTAIDVDTALAPVEVINRAEIERSQARSLPDLLAGRAGVSMSNQGGD